MARSVLGVGSVSPVAMGAAAITALLVLGALSVLRAPGPGKPSADEMIAGKDQDHPFKGF